MKRNLANAVLLLRELLESILVHVDMHTLLMSQRVCCVWYKVITGSKALQEALYFRAIESTDVMYFQRTRNPLLNEIIWPRFIDPDWRVKDARNLESFNRPSARWWRIFFQQPPTSAIGIIELRTLWPQNETWYYEQLLTKPDNDYLRIEVLYRPIKELMLIPAWTTWLFCDRHTQLCGERYSFSDRTIDVATKECDFVLLVW